MRDYKKHIWRVLLTIKYSQKHIWKACSLLSVFLIFGISEAHAIEPITIGLIVVGVAGLIAGKSLVGKIVGEVGEQIVAAIAWLINGVVGILGTIFFWVANTTIDWAMNMNRLIGESFIIKDGYAVAQSVVNMGFVLGFVVIAIAVIVRANWLVDVRKTIPKFITAVLLVNFGYWIGINLLIKPVDGIFQNVYEAAKININTFKGSLSPDLDIKAVAGPQMRISKIDEGHEEFAERYLNYIRFREERISPGVEELLRHYELGGVLATSSPAYDFTPSDYSTSGAGHFSCVPSIGQGEIIDTSGEKQVVPAFVIPAQRTYVRDGIIDKFDHFLEDMNDGAQNNTRNEFTRNGWGGGNENIDKYFDDIGAPYKECSDSSGDLEKLQDAIADFLSAQLAKSYANAPLSDGPRNDTWGFDCTLWNSNGSPVYEDYPGCVTTPGAPNDNYDDWSASNLGFRAREGLSSVEEMVLLILEVLFNAAFTFIGAFTLLGIGLLLIYRYVALSLLMILFPFAWLGWVFPKIAIAGGSKDIWNAWWGQFLRWLLFGPVAMFFIYLSARAAINLDALTTSPGEALIGMGSMAIIAASVGNAAVVIGLLLGGMQVADKFGIAGAGMIMGAVKEVSKVAGKTSATLVGKGATRAAGGAVMGIGAAMGGRGAPQNAEGMRTGLRGRLYDVGRNLEERGRSTVVKDKDGRAVTRRVVTDANGNIDHAWRVQTDAEGKREYQRNQGTQANPDWVASTERDAHQNGRATTTDPYRRAELRTSDTVLARRGRIGRAFRRGGGPSASLQVKAEAQSMWRSPFNIFGEVLRTGKRAAKKGK